MNTKIISIMALSIILLMTMPAVFADDVNATEINLDENTISEIQIMNTSTGAEVRLLQLEKSITRNALVGAKVIEVIQSNHPEFDLTDAEAKLTDLEILLDDVKNYNIELNAETLVEDFVAMKKEAITIAQDFKSITGQVLTAQDKQEIHDAVSNLDTNQLAPIGEAIRATIRMHNAEKISGLFGAMDMNKDVLIKQIRNGEMTKAQVMTSLKEAFNGVKEDQKQLVGAKIREQTVKRIVAQNALIQKAITKAQNKYMQRLNQLNEKRIAWEQKFGEDMNKFSYENRIQRMIQIADLNSARTQKIANQIGIKNMQGGNK